MAGYYACGAFISGVKMMIVKWGLSWWFLVWFLWVVMCCKIVSITYMYFLVITPVKLLLFFFQPKITGIFSYFSIKTYIASNKYQHPWSDAMFCGVYSGSKLFAKAYLSQYLMLLLRVVGGGKGVVYLTSPGLPAEIGLQLGKAWCSCNR